MNTAEQLDKWIQQNRNRPFDWAGWNCCTMIESWVSSVTGNHYLHLFPHSDSWTAKRHYMKHKGVDGIIRSKIHLLPLGQISRPMVGDIAAVQVGKSKHTVGAICCGRNWYILAGKDGLSPKPLSFDKINTAWRIII